MKKIIKLTENDLHQIISNTVARILKEDGATTCGSVMQSGVNGDADGTNPSAGQYDVPFGTDNETKKRSKDFNNGSMMMQKSYTDTMGKSKVNEGFVPNNSNPAMQHIKSAYNYALKISEIVVMIMQDKWLILLWKI